MSRIAQALGMALAIAALGATSSTACSRISVTASSVAFGNYRPRDATSRTTSARIDVECRDDRVAEGSYELRISKGNSDRFERRVLTNGPDQLEYNLFSDATLATLLGDGTGASAPIRGIFAPGPKRNRTHLVYGVIPAGQAVPSGVYSDVLVIQVVF